MIYPVFFNAGSHIYFDLEGLQYRSVTDWCGDYCEPFARDMVAINSAKKRLRETGGDENNAIMVAIESKKIIKEWEAETNKGTAIHELLERYFKGDSQTVSTLETELIISITKLFPPEAQFWAEVRVCVPEIGIAGTIDLIAYYSGKYHIIDYKTSKDISYKPKAKLKPPFDHIPGGSLGKYRLQLSAYHYLLTANGNVVSDELTIIQIDRDSLAIKEVFKLDKIEIGIKE